MKFSRYKNWRAYVAVLYLGAWCLGPLLPFIALDLMARSFGWLGEKCNDAGEWLGSFDWADRLYDAFCRRMTRVHAWVERGD